MSDYTDDGIELLFIEEVAGMVGDKVSTIRRYATAAKQKRRTRKRTGIHDFPAPSRHVYREVPKADGKVNTVYSPLWRKDRIQTWMDNKRGPGGRPARRDEEAT